MLILIAILFVIVLIVIIIFAAPQFSPIPYFPSNRRDLPYIIYALRLENKQVVFDLGAGDGRVIFAAAQAAFLKKLTTQFVAIELNPLLTGILCIRRLLHPNKKNITIIWGNMFKINYLPLVKKQHSVMVYIYVSPRFISKVLTCLQQYIDHFTVVSYFYSIDETEEITYPGLHPIYVKDM